MAAGESKSRGRHSQQPSTKKNLSRRVSFNESTITQSSITQSSIGDVESQIDDEKAGHKRNICCNYCCAWVSIILGTIILVLMILGIIFFSLCQSNMPDFYVLSLDVLKLEVNSTASDTFLNADIVVSMNATNINSNFDLYYSTMRVETTLDGVYLGKTYLPEVSQKSGVSTVLKPQTVLNNEPVPEADGKKIAEDSRNREMVINVDLGGFIHYLINGNKMAGFPFRVMCHGINQTQLDNQQAAKCQVKLTPVS